MNTRISLTRILDRIRIEHICNICSRGSKLQIQSICSIRILATKILVYLFLHHHQKSNTIDRVKSTGDKHNQQWHDPWTLSSSLAGIFHSYNRKRKSWFYIRFLSNEVTAFFWKIYHFLEGILMEKRQSKISKNLSYKSTICVPFEFVLEIEISSKYRCR